MIKVRHFGTIIKKPIPQDLRIIQDEPKKPSIQKEKQ